MTPVGGAALTAEARALYDAFMIRSGARCSRPAARACVTAPALAPALVQDWHPRNLVLAPRTALPGRRIALFARQEREENVLTNISTRRLKRLLARSRRREPREYRRFLAEVRQALGTVPRRRRREAVPLLRAMARLVPARSFPKLVPRTYRRSGRLRRQLDAINRHLQANR